MEEFKKRRHERLSSLNLVDYVIMDDEGNFVGRGMGRTRNLSEAGLLLETYRSLQTGQDILLSLGLKNEIVQARGRVVHTVQPTPERSRLSGIKFIVIGDRDKRTLKRSIEATAVSQVGD